MDNKQNQEIMIVKASGEKEPFSETKLRRSLQRVRVTPAMIDDVVVQIKNELKDSTKTSDIYRRAFALLRQFQSHTASRYGLKAAIMKLGPSGHPFEKFIGELLKSQGFSVEVSRVVPGFCVTHEIDVIGKKDNRCIMVECKFHNEHGIKSDIKIALYIQARFEDLQKQWQSHPDSAQKFDEAWLVTNTKLTSEAIQYAECVGMKALGWNYPSQNGLEILIERAGLHPLTSLTSISDAQKRILLDNGLVLSREIVDHPDILRSLNVSEKKTANIIKEINELLTNYRT
jgi:Holliday junction resolvase-like predicted endonuclease